MTFSITYRYLVFVTMGSTVSFLSMFHSKNPLKISRTSEETIKKLITKLGKTDNGFSFYAEMIDCIIENNHLRLKTDSSYFKLDSRQHLFELNKVCLNFKNQFMYVSSLQIKEVHLINVNVQSSVVQ